MENFENNCSQIFDKIWKTLRKFLKKVRENWVEILCKVCSKRGKNFVEKISKNFWRKSEAEETLKNCWKIFKNIMFLKILYIFLQLWLKFSQYLLLNIFSDCSINFFLKINLLINNTFNKLLFLWFLNFFKLHTLLCLYSFYENHFKSKNLYTVKRSAWNQLHRKLERDIVHSSW